MRIFDFKIIDSLPALYHEELDLAAVSDLHLGLEGSMTRDGNYVPKHQLKELKRDIELVKEETGASRLLVNGDLKNEFKTRYTESNEIQDFLQHTADLFDEIILIRGNHDTFVDTTLESLELRLEDYHLEDGILFVHGDREVEELDAPKHEIVIIGHEHPALVLTDDVGVKEKLPCFLYGEQEDRKIVVMPAFSAISSGTSINEVPKSKLLSPVLKQFDVKELEAIAVSREAGLFDFPEIGKITF